MNTPISSRADATVIRPDAQGTIYEYPAVSQGLRLAFMEVKGRRPSSDRRAFLERDCTFAIYVVKGNGTLWVDGKDYKLTKDDTATVLPGKRWYIEGTLSYVAASTPAFYPEQCEIIAL